MDVSCIPQSSCCCLFVPLFFHFSFSNFQTLKCFVTLFSATVRPTLHFNGYLKLVTHVNRDGCIVYTGIRLLLRMCPFISSFFFPSNFLTIIFIVYFSGTLRATKLKLGIHVNNECMYVDRCIVYIAIKLMLLIHPFIFSLQFSKIFVTLFSGSVSPRYCNLLHTWTVSGCIVCIAIRLLLLLFMHPFISSFFFLFNDSNIYIFHNIFL